MGLNLDELGSWDLYENHAVTTSNFGIISAFAWWQKKTKKTCVEEARRYSFLMHTDI
jgi:hypothetical protein